MTTEFDLNCAECGGPLSRSTISKDPAGRTTARPLPVAECPQCGGRYYPESTLERL